MNTTEIDIKKACQMNKPSVGAKTTHIGSRMSPSTSGINTKGPFDLLERQIVLLKSRLERRNIKVSKVAEA